MMNEENKAHDLEFITVEANATAADAPATNVRLPTSPRGKRSKIEDGEALLKSMRSTVTKAKHPVAAFFHLLFKALALFVYLFGNVVFSSYVFIFVVCILLLAFDFWTVKNVAGRLLVGLRWWNRIHTDGSSEWVFESLEDMTEIDARDAQVFWTALYGAPVVWSLLLVVALLKFNIQWALIAAVALVLSAANIVGYTKCKKDARSKVDALFARGALHVIGSNGASGNGGATSLLSTLGGLALSSASSAMQTATTTTTSRSKGQAAGASVTV